MARLFIFGSQTDLFKCINGNKLSNWSVCLLYSCKIVNELFSIIINLRLHCYTLICRRSGLLDIRWGWKNLALLEISKKHVGFSEVMISRSAISFLSGPRMNVWYLDIFNLRYTVLLGVTTYLITGANDSLETDVLIHREIK